MIETEAALARAQSKVGIIPAEAGEELTKALEAAKIEYATHNWTRFVLHTLYETKGWHFQKRRYTRQKGR